MSEILVTALSPDDKLIYQFDNNLCLGEVNRAACVHRVAAGKGINATRAARILGASVRVVGVVGGPGGERIVKGLESIGAESSLIRTVSPTRCCVTLIERSGGTVTELVENSGPVTDLEVEEFKRMFTGALAQASVVLLTGSVPDNCPESIYGELIGCVRRERGDIPVIVDAQSGLLLESLKGRPTVVKPNRKEIAQALGIPEPADPDLPHAARELIRRGAQSVLISAGHGRVFYTDGREDIWYLPPVVDSLNTVGCGDALAGAMAAGFHIGLSIGEVVALGLASASASARTLYPAQFEAEDARGLVSQVSKEALS